MKDWSFLGRRSRRRFVSGEEWQEWVWGLGLLLATLFVFGVNLSAPPLQPPEIELAVRGRAIATSPHFLILGNEQFSQFYLEESPFLPLLIAFAYRWGTIDGAVTRWPMVGLAVLSVFCLYRIGREIFPRRRTAAIAAWIYLVLSPLIPLGRLALPTVAASALTIVTVWLTLRSRRDCRWSLGIGLGLGLLVLTQAWLSLVAGGIVLGFLAWDTPRLLRSLYLWVGIILGGLPVFGWLEMRPPGSGLPAIAPSSLVLPLSYELKILCFALPGLFLGLAGLSVAIARMNWGWAKLTLIWLGGALVASLLLSFAPESTLLLFPPLALAGGCKLSELLNLPGDREELSGWSRVAIALALVALTGCLGFAWFFPLDRSAVLVFAAVALCLAMVALSISQQDRQSLILLFWGMYIAWLVFACTLH